MKRVLDWFAYAVLASVPVGVIILLASAYEDGFWAGLGVILGTLAFFGLIAWAFLRVQGEGDSW